MGNGNFLIASSRRDGIAHTRKTVQEARGWREVLEETSDGRTLAGAD